MCVDTLCSLQNYSSLEGFLVQFPNISRAYLKRELTKSKRQRKVSSHELIQLPAGLLNYGLINLYQGPELDCLYEDDKFLVIYKLANQHCYPLSYLDQLTVVNWIRYYNFKLLEVNKEHYDRGLLYRLDYATSGGLIYVKSDRLLQQLRKKINTTITKEYLALVEGHIQSNFYLEEKMQPFGPRGAKMRISEVGAEARLKGEIVSYIKDMTLIKINLFTGVRHQIRCQLANWGHPVVGDSLYGSKEADRLYLHAWRYIIDEKELFNCPPREGNLWNNFFGLNGRT